MVHRRKERPQPPRIGGRKAAHPHLHRAGQAHRGRIGLVGERDHAPAEGDQRGLLARGEHRARRVGRNGGGSVQWWLPLPRLSNRTASCAPKTPWRGRSYRPLGQRYASPYDPAYHPGPSHYFTDHGHHTGPY